MKTPTNRRNFLKTTAAAGAVATRCLSLAGILSAGIAPAAGTDAIGKPVKLGGKPVRKALFPDWPVIDETEETALLKVLKSKKWFRGSGKTVAEFEAAYAALTGAKHCVAVANGTGALFASCSALGVGPGDEVIVPPYTFVATISAVLLNYALPVFVDTDPDSFQMDATKIEAAISERTAAILPVHLGGNVCDLDKITEIAQARKIPVIEDTCQSHLAEWRGKKAGTFGAAGCFSFQASKNLNSGEGGAVITNDDQLAEKVAAFQNNAKVRHPTPNGSAYLGTRGANLRLTEFQAALLLAQMARIEAQAKTRTENATYLTRQLREIPGIMPARMHEGCTRNAYHLYLFRYHKEHFSNLPKSKFLSALSAEGIPVSGGYTPLNTEAFLKDALKSKVYQRLYPQEVLSNWAERTACPANDRLCGEAAWFTQTMLLGPRQDMDDIVAAIRKVQTYSADLAKL